MKKKKLFQTILIALVIGVQLFAPFTLGLGEKNNVVVKNNRAEAAKTITSYDYVKYHADGTKQEFQFPTETECETARAASATADAAANIPGEVTGICIAVWNNETLVAIQQESDGLPECSFIPVRLGGCIAQILYIFLFKPTSKIFALAGKILDVTVMYSLSDTSYRSLFVVQGWQLVRDFCNMFFIFVLLYIAVGTILNLHSVKTKEMIINVVIIGLFINFSLFVTQIIIDSSNILARVFYNPQTIVVGPKDASGKVVGQLGENGELQLSAGIINKVDPQKLVMGAKEIDKIKIKSEVATNGTEETTKSAGGEITVGTFILITLLATAVNIVGIVVFLSASLIFVARVVGLWLSMIFAPMAFFSYTVPALRDIEMIGWKKWWPDLLKMAFLAPIFVFFMYIIIGFMDKALGLGDTVGKEGLAYASAVMVPFIFIMVLLMKAKDIAKTFSGSIGQSITNGIAAAGGIALGGAAIGTALAGRKIIGGISTKASNSASAKHHLNQKVKFDAELAKWEADKAAGKTVGVKPEWDKYKPKNGESIGKDENGKDIKYHNNPYTWIGRGVNMSQYKANQVDRARHHADEDMEKAGFKGYKYSELSALQRKDVKDSVKREKYTKEMTEAEQEYRSKKGNEHLMKKEPLTDKDKEEIIQEEKDKISATRRIADPNYIFGTNKDDVIEAQESANKRIREENATGGRMPALSVDDQKAVKALAETKAVEKFEKNIEKAAEGVDAFTRVFSKANTGSYDIRKLSDITADKRASWMTKASVGLIAGVATGVRAGILQGSGLSGGGVKIEGRFLNDLKSVVGDSLKGMKVSVPETHSGGETKKVGHGSDAHH